MFPRQTKRTDILVEESVIVGYLDGAVDTCVEDCVEAVHQQLTPVRKMTPIED